MSIFNFFIRSKKESSIIKPSIDLSKAEPVLVESTPPPATDIIIDSSFLSKDPRPKIQVGDIIVCIKHMYDSRQMGAEFEIVDFCSEPKRYKKFKVRDLSTAKICNIFFEVELPKEYEKYYFMYSTSPFSGEELYCKKSELEDFSHVLQMNKNLQMEFKIKTSPSTGYISVWYTTNHPDHQDWIALKSVKNQCDATGRMYIFESVEDANIAIQWLKNACSINPWFCIKNGGVFSKNWLSDANDWEDVK